MKIDTYGIKEQKAFIVVGIGAASGSLEALKEIVVNLKKDSHIAYLIQLRLSQEEEILFKEILELYSSIPALHLNEKTLIAPNYIYLISNNDFICAKENGLQVIRRPDLIKQNGLFNAFFTTLAEVYKERIVAVLLCGEDDDGTKGFVEIKKQGGVSIVQHPATTIHREMAAQVLRLGEVDLVVTPAKLIHYIFQIRDCIIQRNDADMDRLAKILADNIFEQIYSELIQGRSPDFAFYNKSIIRGKVKQRIKECALQSEKEYLQYLHTSEQELALLCQYFKLPDTTFFRNHEVFTFLAQTVYPRLVQGKSITAPLRIWVIGCSTGQEVYTFAISIFEFLEKEKSGLGLKIQIFATDIAENAIAKAKTGCYNKNELTGLSAIRIKNYFTEVEGVFTINRTLRNCCTFAVHDFLKEPPFPKIDLISCRNLLSSMDSYWQKKAFSVFDQVLTESGIVMLGLSESGLHGHKLFAACYRTFPIFSPIPLSGDSLKTRKFASSEGKQDLHPKTAEEDYWGVGLMADRELLARYAPPPIILNRQFDLIQIGGDATSDGNIFLFQPASGDNISKFMAPLLVQKLHVAIEQVDNTGSVFEVKNIKLSEAIPNISVQVFPVAFNTETYFLVVLKQDGLQPLNQNKAHLEKLRSSQSVAQYPDTGIIADPISLSLKNINLALEAKTEALESVQVELVSTNQELQERNEKLDQYRNMTEAIISTLHESFLILNEKFIIQSVNKTFLKHFKCKESAVLGVEIFDIQNGGWNIPGLKDGLEKIRNKETSYIELEVSFVFPRIGLQDVCFILKPIFVQDSGTLYLVALEDLTQRRVNERNLALAKERQTYYDFFMQTPAAICILTGRDFVFEFANPAFIQLIGERNPLGKSIRVAIGELGEEYFSIFENVYDTKTPYVGKEIPVLLKDVDGNPKRKFLNITCQVFKDVRGESEGIMVFLYDISDLIMAKSKIRQNESNLKQILEDLPVMTWTNLIDGHINFYNQKWYSYTGVNFDDEKWGGWKSIIHPEDLTRTLRAFKRALHNGVNFEIENRYKRSDGVYRWHLNRAIPIYIEDEIIIWVGTATDINDQKISEQKKDEFLSIASHEMKTPLTTATAYIQLIEQNLHPGAGDHRLYANKALISMHKLNDLIAELLDVSKIHHGKLAYNIEELDFNDVVNSSIESIHYVAPDYLIIKDGEVKTKIKGDKGRLQQVLVNLLSNAIKYSPDHPVVWVNVIEHENCVIVKIKDQGIGIYKDQLGKIFDRYYRVNQQDAIKFQGLGIGLYIANEIVIRHGGTLWAESAYGQGSEFCFSIPF